MRNALPEGWVIAPLGDLAQMRRGITYDSSQLAMEEGGIAYVNMKSFLKGGGFNRDGTKTYSGTYSTSDLLQSSDVFLANTDVTSGDIVGVPALLSEELREQPTLFSHHVTRLRLGGSVMPEFLHYLLSLPEYRGRMLRIARGTTVLMLDMQALKRVPIRFPKRQDVQSRIAEILSTVDDAIEQTELLIAKTQQIKAGLMNDLFTRGVTADGQLRPPREEAPQLYKQSPLGWIPKEWTAGHLSDRPAANRPHIKTGPFGSSLKLEHWVDDGVPVITIGALGEGQFIESQLLHVSEQTAGRLREYRLIAGDIVFSRVANVGRSAVITENERGWIMSSNLMRISLDAAQVVPQFLQTLLAYDSRVRAQIRATVNAGGREVANSAILNRLYFCWPTVLEQERIVDRFNALEARQRSLAQDLQKYEEMKVGLMHDLLTGCVSVAAGPSTHAAEDKVSV